MTGRDAPYERGLRAEINVLRRSMNTMHTQHVAHETWSFTVIARLHLALGLAFVLLAFTLGVALFALLRTT